MNESITRAASGVHDQEMPVAALVDLARRIGRTSWQRTTLYRPVAVRAGIVSMDLPTA